eukprot:scaffold6358_cov80-Cylindrotheca_fusiformis.AAC.1
MAVPFSSITEVPPVCSVGFSATVSAMTLMAIVSAMTQVLSLVKNEEVHHTWLELYNDVEKVPNRTPTQIHIQYGQTPTEVVMETLQSRTWRKRYEILLAFCR